MSSTSSPQLEHERKTISIALMACTCVVFVFLCLRLYTRIFLTKRLTWDDGTLVLSFAAYVVFNALSVCTLWNWQNAITLETFERLFNMGLAVTSMYVVYEISFHISLVLFFLPFTMHPWQRRFLLSVCTVYILCLLAYVFVCLFKCGPPKDQVRNIFSGSCSYYIFNVWTYLVCSLNAATDWLFALVPAAIVWRLQMQRADRIAACALVLLASLGSVASVVRLAYGGGVHPKAGSDEINAASVYTILAEMSLGLACVSCATCRPLVIKIFGPVRWGSKLSAPVKKGDTDVTLEKRATGRQGDLEKSGVAVETSSRSSN